MVELVGDVGEKEVLRGGEDGALGRIKCRWKFSANGRGEMEGVSWGSVCA